MLQPHIQGIASRADETDKKLEHIARYGKVWLLPYTKDLSLWKSKVNADLKSKYIHTKCLLSTDNSLIWKNQKKGVG